jgi:hypothetical protein
MQDNTMKAIRQIMEVNGQVLHVTLPKDYNEKKVEVIILPLETDEPKDGKVAHLRGKLQLTEDQYNDFYQSLEKSRAEWENRI